MEILKMLGQILLLVLGFVFMIKGADVFVDGASKIAVKCNIPEMVVGLTIVAVGTSLPELVTSVVAAKKGQNELALGNVIGSRSSCQHKGGTFACGSRDHCWKCAWKQHY